MKVKFELVIIYCYSLNSLEQKIVSYCKFDKDQGNLIFVHCIWSARQGLRYYQGYYKRGSNSTAKLQMEFLVKTMLPFLEKYTLLRIAVPYF